MLQAYALLTLALLTCTPAARIHVRRVPRQLFRRDSVEKVANYPFSRPIGSSRSDDLRTDLMEYVFGVGSRTLPIRESVESLPIPLLTSEERSFSDSKRLPLRDAVEQRPTPADYHEEESRYLDPADIIVEDSYRSRGASRGAYSYTINFPGYPYQFDPSRYQLLPNPGSFRQASQPNYSSEDEDSVEILPSRWEYGKSLMRKRGKGKKQKKPTKELGRHEMSDKSSLKTVCYLEGWANYRQEPMRFNNQGLDPFACTHIIYAFAAIDPHRFFIYPQDEEHDLVQGGYKSVVGLKRKNPNLKILISVGGWSDDDPKFTAMASSARRRQKFIRSVAKFLDKYAFDGIDLDWQYPGSEDMGGSRIDKTNLSQLLEELSEVFKVRQWTLSIAVPPSRFRVDDGYNVQEIAQYVDMINIQAFDLHAERDLVADHHSPLFRRDTDRGLDVFYNADYAVQYWVKRGAPRSKIILGIPFFGRSFTLEDARSAEAGADVKGPGKEGKYTQESGFLAYFEVCEKMKENGWKKYVDSVGSPYMVKDDQWVGFDDVHSVKNKAEYIKKEQLGGAGIYAIDLDDFNGMCGEKWPLLRALKRGFNSRQPMPAKPIKPEPSPPSEVLIIPPVEGFPVSRPGDLRCQGQGYAPDPTDCRQYHRCMWGSRTSYVCPGELHFDPALALCNWPSLARCEPPRTKLEVAPKVSFKDEYKIVCYYTSWSSYRKGNGKFVPENMDPSLCTHIVYAYSTLDPNDLTIKSFDPMADNDHNFYGRLVSLTKSSNAKILLGLGGWTDSTGDKYSRMVRDSSARSRFIAEAVAFLKTNGFQGLHIDWNYPKCWQSNCNLGPDSDRSNYAALIQELRIEFNRQDPPLILAAAISGYREVIDVAYDVPSLTKSLDFMSVMTYDYHGAWEKRTGHISPLYYRTADSFPRFNTNYTLEYLSSLGADRKKLVMGIPFYGQSFTLANERDNGYGAPADGPGVAGELTRQPGMLAYYEICNNVRKRNWIVSRDMQGATGPYAFQSDQWVSYDDIESVEVKAKHIRNLGFGGAMAWTVDLDDFSNTCCRGTFPLLRTIGRVLGHLNEIGSDREDCTKPQPPATPAPPITTTGVDTGNQWSTTPPHVHPTTPTPTTSTNPTWTWPTPTTTERYTTTTTRRTTTRQPSTTTPSPTSTSTWPSWTSSTTSSTTSESTTTTKPWWETSTTTTTTTTTTPTTPSTTTTETTDNNVIPTKPCEPGRYYPDTLNCNAYYRCLRGEYYKQYCIGGLHWNANLNICDWPESASCDKQDIQGPEVPAPTPTSTTQRPSTWWTEASTTSQKPSTWWTEASTTSQKPSTWWTEATSQSTWWTQSTTERYTTTTQRPTRPPTSTTASLPQGPCNSGAYYSVPGSCESFAICVNGRLVTQRCANGLQWNQNQKICDWSSNVKCGTTTERVADGTGDAKENLQDRPCSPGSYAQYPGDCNKYLSCLWGVYQVYNCAPGLHWNNVEKICDWPNPSRCQDLVGGPGGSSDGGMTRPTIRPTPPSVTRPTQPTSPGTAATIVPPPTSSKTGYFKIVCYFTNWAWYRPGEGKYLPEDIDEDLCTHIIYGFAVLDYENLIIKPHDSWADIDNKFYDRVVAFKKKGLKVSLAIGGWNDSQGDKYSRLVNNPSARARFVKHVVEFLQKYDFDGLDLDWEYPKCWQADCKKGPSSDKAGFAAWVQELYTAFKPHGFLLSSAVSPSKVIIDAGYDVPSVAQHFDWIAVMTYDYHGQWDKRTGHVAPMYYYPGDEFDYFNANYSINYWLSEGVPRRKLVMGMPLYGQSFSLANADQKGLNANAPGPGTAGEFTRAAGFLAYYEICDRIQNQGWNVVQDSEKRMGPYAYKGNQWVSFDDVAMIHKKSEYIRSLDLGGGMIWALDLDDFRNRCGGGKHPLLTTIRQVLGPAGQGPTVPPPTTQLPYEPTTEPGENDIKPPQSSSTSYPPTATTAGTPGLDMTTVPSVDQTTRWTPVNDYKVVCYFTNWAWYRQGVGKFVPGDIDPSLCTHIIYGFAVLNGDQGIIKPHDTWADFDNQFYKKVTDFKARGIKVLVAIGGWNDSAGDKYSRLVNNPSARAKFIAHVLEFIEQHNFDGLDLDWEYPKCWQVNCKMGPDSDKPAFAAFVRELRAAFTPKGLLLSAAVSPAKQVIDKGYDVPTLSRDLDWISVMTYDYHGQWDKITGHVAPMYPHPDDIDVTFNANFSINYWIKQGADPRKIVMGMPMYGQSFSLADNSDHGLNAATYGGGEAGEHTRARGFLSYYEICHNIRTKNWKVIRDKKKRMGPYAYLRDQWVGFDDQAMIMLKSEYIRAMGLGGGMIWALDLDDFRDRCHCETYPLLKTINRVLRNYPGPQPRCSLEGIPSDDNNVARWPFEDKPTPPTKQAVNCDGRMFADYTSDCNKYYQCIHGQMMVMACPSGLHWNKDHCDWPEKSSCNDPQDNEITPPVMGETTSTTTSTSTAAPTQPTTALTTTTTTVETPRPGTTTTTTQRPLPQSDYKVVCYFTNWAWYRQGIGKYTPDNIDFELCTHIAYGFAVLDGTLLTIKPHDSWADIDNDFYHKVTELRQKGIKVLIAIGGWNDSLGDKYSRLVADPNSRQRFIENVMEFIEKYGFDGLDLDWEYPKCWQVNCNQGPDEDKANFAAFVKELSTAFKPKGWLLSSAVSPSKVVIDLGYDVPALSQYFDYISVMTYDFHGHWDKATGHVAPLYYVPGDTYDYFNANFSIHYWIEQGADPKKIIMGMPLYGQSFTLTDPSVRGLNAPASGPGEAGEFTRAAGFLAFYEICEKVKRQGWTVIRDDEGRIGPYAFRGNQWVSYDDASEIRRKSRLVKRLGLGGGMVWALDLDDFRNRCGCGSHPLLKTLNQELRGVGGKFNDCT